MAEYKIIVSGPMGAGKSTLLTTISEITPVRTEALNTQRGEADKPTTTVAMDYGEVDLGNDDVLRLYGTPGQERFSFMRGILAKGALGIVLLIDASRSDPAGDLQSFIEGFDLERTPQPLVVGITKSEIARIGISLTLQDKLRSMGMLVPCFQCDVRDRGQVRTLLEALLAIVEMSGAGIEQPA